MELVITEKGGIMPTTNINLWEMENQAYENKPNPDVNTWELLLPFSKGVKCYKKHNNIVVAVRGTADMRDIQADLQIVYSGITNSSRYKEDINVIQQIQLKFPKSQYNYYAVGHSLGGAIIDELIAQGYVLEGLSYNPAVDLTKFRNNPLHHRVYNSDDILYNIMGKFTKNPKVRKNKLNWKQRVFGLLPFGKLGNSVKAHLLSNFVGGVHLVLA
jgi:hypothetical protein